MSQFEHESPDQSAACNRLIREMRKWDKEQKHYLTVDAYNKILYDGDNITTARITGELHHATERCGVQVYCNGKLLFLAGDDVN